MAKKNTPSINLGNLDNIEDINRFLNKVVHDMMSSIAENHEASAKSATPSYGFSVRIDHNGIPVINNIGNQKSEEKPEPPQKQIQTEPLADVIETENTVSVIAEAHGAVNGDISLKCDGNTLLLEINRGATSYSKSLRLPSSVTPRGASARLNCGVLEITMKKVRAYNGKAMNIKLK